MSTTESAEGADEEAESAGCCPTRLVTPRLTLRRPDAGDAAEIAGIANNPDVARWLARMPYPYNESDAQAWIRAVNEKERAECAFVIETVIDGRSRIVGACGYGRMEDLDLPQVGYWIGQPYWNNGFATEAVHALVDHVFGSTDLDAIGAGCRVTNTASRRVIEKCGFQYCGVDMLDSRFENAVVPIFAFRLTRKTWESLKAWAAAS